MIAKRYLERRLGAPVLEMTRPRRSPSCAATRTAATSLPVVRDLAEAADRVKFAKGQGLAPEAERHLAAVRGPRPRPRGDAAAGRDGRDAEGKAALMDWAASASRTRRGCWPALAGPLVLLAAWLRERDGRARASLSRGVAPAAACAPGWRVRLRHLPVVLAALRPRGWRPSPSPARSTARCART